MQLELIDNQPSAITHTTPILFVHGAWHGAWCWEKNFLPYFAQHGYPAYAMSWRGHGTSEGREKLLRSLARDYVDDVAASVEKLQRETGRLPIIVGHSLGGYVTQKYLERQELPAAVLLASLPSYGALPLFVRLMLHHPTAYLKTLFTFNGYHLIGTQALTHESFFSADVPPAEVKAYFERMIPESFFSGLEACVNLPRTDKIKTPMLVLGAANDRVFTQGEVRRTAKAYNAEVEIFPNMAHDMMLERGWQQVADRMIVWLDKRGL